MIDSNVNRFIIIFNEEGKPDIDNLIKNQTNVNLLEFAAELNEILGNKTHSLQQDGFHLATLEMIGIKIPKIPGITSEELEQFKKAFMQVHSQHKMTFTEAHYVLNFISKNLEELNSNCIFSGRKVVIKKLKNKDIKQSNIEDQHQFNIQKSLEKCRQTLFAFSFIVSKYKKHQGNNWNIFNIKCLNCEENSYFSDGEKNEIYEFVKDLSKNVIEKCEFIAEWQNDLYRKSLDYTLNYEHKPKEYEHLKIKITDLNTQYINFVDVIRSNKPHVDVVTHQQSLSINNGEQSKHENKIIPDRESHTNLQSIPLLNQHEVAVNNFFKNLDDITAKIKKFETKLVDIKTLMEKNKSVKNELYQNNFADIIEEKMEFLLKNWEKIFEGISEDKDMKEIKEIKEIFKNSGHQFVGCGIGTCELEEAINELDRCCEIHDKCYREYDAKWASQCGWTWFDRSPYTEAYSYECDESTGYITSCSTENSPCEKFLCECDKL
uniref:VHS domain-containing protein n=1 Tax=Meloidogyne floridensis TaxID=298350 RepID=A0A915P963_9BILA